VSASARRPPRRWARQPPTRPRHRQHPRRPAHPLLRALDSWRTAATVWALPPLATLALLPVLLAHRTPHPNRQRRPARTTRPPWRRRTAARGGSHDTAPSPRRGQHRETPLWRDHATWLAAAHFGAVCATTLSLTSCLPALLRATGHTPAQTGLAFATAIPPRRPHRGQPRHGGPLLAALHTATATGVTGLAVHPTGPVLLWAFLVGTGLGAFPHALATLTRHAADAPDPASFTAATHGTGYLVAATAVAATSLLTTAHGPAAAPPLLPALATTAVVLGRPLQPERRRQHRRDQPQGAVRMRAAAGGRAAPSGCRSTRPV
jgi:cyanate permease